MSARMSTVDNPKAILYKVLSLAIVSKFFSKRFVVGLFFLALWVTCLVKGAPIDAEMARREAEAGPPYPADRVDG